MLLLGLPTVNNGTRYQYCDVYRDCVNEHTSRSVVSNIPVSAFSQATLGSHHLQLSTLIHPQQSFVL